jgi:hypothetical protein
LAKHRPAWVGFILFFYLSGLFCRHLNQSIESSKSIFPQNRVAAQTHKRQRMAGGTGELKGVLDLARECWQRASGQTEHPDYTSAQDFVTAAAQALGHKLVAG